MLQNINNNIVFDESFTHTIHGCPARRRHGSLSFRKSRAQTLRRGAFESPSSSNKIPSCISSSTTATSFFLMSCLQSTHFTCSAASLWGYAESPARQSFFWESMVPMIPLILSKSSRILKVPMNSTLTNEIQSR